MLTGLALAASASGIVCGLLPLIQISRMLRTHTSEGFSLGYVAGNLANAAIFGSYGVALGNLQVACSNLLWVLTGSVMFLVAAHERRCAHVGALGPARTAAAEGLLEWSEADTLIIPPGRVITVV